MSAKLSASFSTPVRQRAEMLSRKRTSLSPSVSSIRSIVSSRSGRPRQKFSARPVSVNRNVSARAAGYGRCYPLRSLARRLSRETHKILDAPAEEARFAADSPLEGTGFEPSVPLLRKGLSLNGDAGPISWMRPIAARTPQLRRRAGSVTAGAFRGSVRLAKFQHVDIDRLSRGTRGGVSGIPGDVEEIGVVDQFECRRLNLRPDQRLVRTRPIVQTYFSKLGGAGVVKVLRPGEVWSEDDLRYREEIDIPLTEADWQRLENEAERCGVSVYDLIEQRLSQGDPRDTSGMH